MRESILDLGPVHLARFVRADFDAIHAFAANPEVCRHQTWGPNTPQDTHAFLEAALQPRDDSYQLAVLRQDAVIGSAAVWTTSPENQNGEIGYTFHPDFWGLGYATLVAKSLARLGFVHLNLKRVAATCRPDNIGSIRVLEKAGFRQEGRLRSAVLVHGERQDSLVFGKLATD